MGRSLAKAALGVLDGVEEATSTLGSAASKEATATVQHKYGDDAAETTADALSAAGTTYKSAKTLRRIGVKSTVKKAAKAVAKDAIEVIADKDKANEDEGADAEDTANPRGIM